LAENKKSWHSKLNFSLWVDRISNKKSIGTSPFQMVYGTKSILPNQLGLPFLNFLQEELEEPNDIQRRIFQMIEVQQVREQVNQKVVAHQRKFKATFDKGTMKDILNEGYFVLRSDASREDKAKHGKFDNLWYGPFRIAKVMDKNTFLLYNLDNTETFGGPVNGRFLKHYFL
jgi:hypothetical protein